MRPTEKCSSTKQKNEKEMQRAHSEPIHDKPDMTTENRSLKPNFKSKVLKKFEIKMPSISVQQLKKQDKSKSEESTANMNNNSNKCSGENAITGAITTRKLDQSGPSPLRQLLPVTLCFISFATVMSILIIYIDTTGKIIIFYLFYRFFALSSLHVWTI